MSVFATNNTQVKKKFKEKVSPPHIICTIHTRREWKIKELDSYSRSDIHNITDKEDQHLKERKKNAVNDGATRTFQFTHIHVMLYLVCNAINVCV